MIKEQLEDLYNELDSDLKSKGFARKRWVTLEEARILNAIVEEEVPNHIFESGTANGYSTSWLGLTNTNITTYDIISRNKVWGKNTPPHIDYIKAPFNSMVEKAKTISGKLLFFIDGNHTHKGVKEDVEAVIQVIKKGDVIVFHDLKHRCVVEFWDCLKVFSSPVKYNTKRGIGKLVWEISYTPENLW